MSTRSRGKIVGAVAGALLGLVLKRPLLLVLGLVLGHLYDLGWFGQRAGRERAAPPPAGDTDPYAILGVPSSASDEQVEAAYRKLMSEFHPDRVATSAAEIRELAERRTREANAAYDQIKRQRGR